MIPQSNPKAGYLAHREAIDAAMARIMQSGWYILGDEVKAFEQAFAGFHGAQWGIGVANGTDAVELALRACGVGAGDYVATVSHTAVATVSAIARIGAQPLFADIDPERYTMDPQSLRELLEGSGKLLIKAVVVVHLYGQPADMREILALAKAHGCPVIEDCAQAHGARLHGRSVGTWGDLGCFSFYPTKNLGAFGDGGIIIGNSPERQQELRALREYGWQTRYVSNGVGFNSRLDELQAAILLTKLPYLEQDNARRQHIAQRYDEALSGLVETPLRSADLSHVYHQYVIRTDGREQLRAALQAEGVGTLVHYPLPVHKQPAFTDPAYRPVPLFNTEAACEGILSLPMYPELSDADVEAVITALKKCLPVK